MTHRFETLCFDLDGTLIDTEPSAARAVYETFSGWGTAIQTEDSHYVTGRTWKSAFDYLFGKYGIPVARELAEEKVMVRYRQILETDLVVVPGSVDAIQALAREFPLALVSGSGRAEILWALKKLRIDSHFQIILGAEDYAQSKPAPDGYLLALSSLKAHAHRCLIFEDSQPGVVSARAAGAWVVAITGTNHFKQDTSLAHEKIPDLRPVTTEWVNLLAEKLLSSAPFTRES